MSIRTNFGDQFGLYLAATQLDIKPKYQNKETGFRLVIGGFNLDDIFIHLLENYGMEVLISKLNEFRTIREETELGTIKFEKP